MPSIIVLFYNCNQFKNWSVTFFYLEVWFDIFFLTIFAHFMMFVHLSNAYLEILPLIVCKQAHLHQKSCVYFTELCNVGSFCCFWPKNGAFVKLMGFIPFSSLTSCLISTFWPFFSYVKCLLSLGTHSCSISFFNMSKQAHLRPKRAWKWTHYCLIL